LFVYWIIGSPSTPQLPDLCQIFNGTSVSRHQDHLPFMGLFTAFEPSQDRNSLICHAPLPTQPPCLPDIWTTMALAGLSAHWPKQSPISVPPLSPPSIPPPDSPVSASLKKRRHFKRTLFTESQRAVLLGWLKMHQKNPYPTTSEKEYLMLETGLQRDQINVWFTNNRIRQGITSTHRFGDDQRTSSAMTTSRR
jgi:hypothetical protein